MKTDHLFYELFRNNTYSFFDLLQKKMPCQYQGWSVSLKALERRMDFLFLPEDREKPVYVVEIQGYDDSLIYLRTLFEAFRLFEELELWKAPHLEIVVFFLEKRWDPGWQKWRRLLCLSRNFPLRVVYLDDMPPEFWETAPLPAKNIQILLMDSEEELKKTFWEIKNKIDNQYTLEKQREEATAFLLCFVGSKLPHLSKEEIEMRLELSPFQDTVWGQQFIQQGKKEGLEEGKTQKAMSILSKQLKLKFREKGEPWIASLPLYSENSLEKIEERILFEDSLEKIFHGLEKKKPSFDEA